MASAGGIRVWIGVAIITFIELWVLMAVASVGLLLLNPEIAWEEEPFLGAAVAGAAVLTVVAIVGLRLRRRVARVKREQLATPNATAKTN